MTGTLTFGIGTESKNAIPSTANVYQLDEYGYFGSATFAGVTYTSANSYGSFLDSGSTAFSFRITQPSAARSKRP